METEGREIIYELSMKIVSLSLYWVNFK
jgi:hypothetical protein